MSPNCHDACVLEWRSCGKQKLDGAAMDMQIIQDADEITHVVLDGRFDIQGS